MLFSKQLLSNRLGRYASLTSLLAAGGFLLGACSSGDTAPNNPVGTAGTGTTAGAGGSSAGTSATVGGGGAGVTGGAGSSAVSGSSTGGSAAGGATGGAGVTGGSGGAGGGGTSAGGASGAGGTSNEPFALKSSAFKEGDEIPLMYKCDKVNPKGQNISPPLSWGPGPAGTKSYAIVLNHVQTPEHWAIWDIAANVLSLPENIEHKAQPAAPAGSTQSQVNLDGFNGPGYLGPCPQAPNSRQSYKFTLYALDVDKLPGVSGTSNPTDAAAAIKQHLVGGSQGVSLTGTQIQMP